jgi:hypothetical protein
MVAAFSFARTVIMAFTIRDLSVLAYANGFTLWHYKAGDDLASELATENYFVDASDMIATGDMIMASGTAGCRLLCIAQAGSGTVVSAPVG